MGLRWPLWLTLIVPALGTAVVGGLLSALLARLRGFYLSIATLAFGETMVVVATNIPQLGGADGLSGIPLDVTMRMIVIGAIVVTLVVIWWEHSQIGIITRAIGEDDVAAAAIGIDVRKIKIASFFFGGLLAGFAGALNAHYIGLVAPTDMNFQAEVSLFFYVGIGGMSTYLGALVGAIVVSVLPELLRFSIYDRYLVFGLLLAGMMIVRPYGLVVRRVRGAASLNVSSPKKGRANA
jgi:branched-chain amino acid transport system permease protein